MGRLAWYGMVLRVAGADQKHMACGWGRNKNDVDQILDQLSEGFAPSTGQQCFG